jgi:fructokinase
MNDEFDKLIDGPSHDWLSREALPGSRIHHARALSGGYSNANILLVTGTGDRYILRRYLHGNTCAVEVALAGLLVGIVPVPDVLAADPDGSATGRPVMVSRFMPGHLVSEILPGLAPRDAEALGRSAGAALAAIGTVTFPRPGFFKMPGLIPDGIEPTSGLPDFIDRCLCTGNAHHALTPVEQQALRRHAAEVAPALGAVRGSRQLVHSDFNPKNLLAAVRNGSWTVTAVLDWEFAFSSTPLFDVGNMLRFRGELHPAFADGFIAEYDAVGTLPENWREISHGLDLFALTDLLTRPPDHAFFGKAADRIRARLVLLP